MEQATEQRADKFATADWDLAKEAWDEAEALVAKEQYSGTVTLYLRAKSRFEKARDIAQSKRETLLKQIKDKQGLIEARHAELAERMEKARLSASRKKELEECCGELIKTIEKLKAEVKQGEYLLANDTSEEAMKLLQQAELKMPR
jgi:hypothetical protein